MIADSGPFTEGYWVWPLLKKRGNPFPDRISLGRAQNCDVVFRLGYVSKLHAHVVLDDTRASIADQGSANGTEVNGVQLPPNGTCKLEPGDRIKLGALEVHLLDAGGLYDVLVREVIPHM
jgi:pSer/pThr/pTyr-binding forkhead associated (FHA) protein